MESGLSNPALVVNDGNAQRSQVDSLTVVFPSAITISSSYTLTPGSYTTAGAFTIEDTSSTFVPVNYANPSGDGRTWLITFDSSYTVTGGSLPDGGYTVTVKHSDLGGSGDPSTDQTFGFSRRYGAFNGPICNFGDLVDVVQHYAEPVPQGDWYWNITGNCAGTMGFLELVGVVQNFNKGGFDSGTILTTSFPTPSAGAIPFGITPLEFYYSSSWQLLQTSEFDNQTSVLQTLSQNVWGLAYQNELVLRDYDSDGSASTGTYGLVSSNSGLNQRVYAEQDANWNVVALVGISSGTWQVVQRYDYDAQGNRMVLMAFNSAGGDAFNFNTGWQGGLFDPETGLDSFQHRDYSPVLYRWMTEDPMGTSIMGPLQNQTVFIIELNDLRRTSALVRRLCVNTQLWQYIDGMNIYQFAGDNPLARTDPTGLQRLTEADCIRIYKATCQRILNSFGPGFARFIGFSGLSLGGGIVSGAAGGAVWGCPVGGAIGIIVGGVDELGAIYDYSEELDLYNTEIASATAALKACELKCHSY